MDTIARNHTRVLVIVHSHVDLYNGGVIDCSLDCVKFSSSKTIKGTGGFSFTLVPRKNYHNYLYPNDMVNIYVDVGDGKLGFVRTCCGYIDRVDLEEETDEKGATKSAFQVTCTDFSKAIDKTEIYFNPQLVGREEFTNPDFGLSQLGGGHALRTRGIVANGTPAQMVENMLQLLLGFGTQWVLPRSYPAQNFLDRSRTARRQRAAAQLPTAVQDALSATFGVDINSIDFSIDAALAQALQNNTATGNPTSFYANQAQLGTIKTALPLLQAYQQVVKETTGGSPASIIDLLSFDFIEALTIDGYIASSSVWTNQGSVASMIYGWSNEIVNELCFDLRPVAADAPDQCFGTQYSTAPDELGYNATGTQAMPAATQGVQYTPAVVFREYPYSTVEGLDLTNFYVMGTSAGFQPFGPIFSQGANKPGRRVYNYETAGVDGLTPEKCAFAPGSSPLKHLDVATIYNTDVTHRRIGRSDVDIFNLFELYASSPRPEMWKFILRDLLPVITPVSISRHGLRVRSLTTKYANYSRDQLCSDNSSGIDTAAIRRNIIRWTLLIDHWYQHNVEYLSGQVQMRGRPDIRVGYRLDWVDRNESYYVEGVSHEWVYQQPLRTTLQLSRGQRNDPFPAYIPPILSKSGGVPSGAPDVQGASQSGQLLRARQSAAVAQAGGGDRSENGRLGDFFLVKDTRATSTAVGGEARYQGQNTVDQQDNIPGYAIFPGDAAQRDSQTATESNDQQSVPFQGSDAIK